MIWNEHPPQGQSLVFLNVFLLGLTLWGPGRKYAPELHLGSVEGMAKCSPWMDWLLFSKFHECAELRRKKNNPAIWRVQLSLLARIDHDVNDVKRYRYLW